MFVSPFSTPGLHGKPFTPHKGPTSPAGSGLFAPRKAVLCIPWSQGKPSTQEMNSHPNPLWVGFSELVTPNSCSANPGERGWLWIHHTRGQGGGAGVSQRVPGWQERAGTCSFLFLHVSDASDCPRDGGSPGLGLALQKGCGRLRVTLSRCIFCTRSCSLAWI